MGFYILLYIIVIGVLLCSKKRMSAKISFVILWMVYAFRNNVGVDDGNYIRAFSSIQNGWGYDIEWSYHLLCKLAVSLGFSYKFLFVVYGALSIILLFKAVDLLYEKNYNKAIYMACFFGIVFVSSVSVMRQFLAACFCFYAAAVMYKEDNSFKAIILCIFGSFFHTAAIISIPFIWLIKCKSRITYVAKFIIIIFCIIGGYLNLGKYVLNLFMEILPQSYRIYSDDISGSFSSAGGTLSLLLLGMFIFQCLISIRSNTLEPSNKRDIIIEKGQLVYLGILFFFVHAGVASRLAFTFLLFSATIPITFMKHIQKRQRFLVVIFLILAMLMLMIMTLNSVSQVKYGAFIPYNGSIKFWE